MSKRSLKFHRNSYAPGKFIAGSYFAQDETKQYGVFREGRQWVLEIKNLTTTVGLKHAVGQPTVDRVAGCDTKAIVIAIANAYSELGDDYQGALSRCSNAIRVAYDNIIAAIVRSDS